ncbi:MAG: SUMF1/EgtB/PvdO family nonheme iron enzyme [Fimbriimonadaceae bacterium]|nr:SUMF1/EgtB/PvdO family nonheme iron enzyme [Fimbriimonadaceae bacterium]
MATSPLTPEQAAALSSALAWLAENSVGSTELTVDRAEIGLLAQGLDPEPTLIQEMQRCFSLLRRAAGSADPDLHQMVQRALQDRGASEAAALLAVDRVAAHPSPPAATAATAQPAGLQCAPITVDRPAIVWAALAPKTGAEHQLRVSGGPGQVVAFPEDRIAVAPVEFGPQPTTLTVMLTGGLPGELLWGHLSLTSRQEEVQVEISAHWPAPRLSPSSPSEHNEERPSASPLRVAKEERRRKARQQDDAPAEPATPATGYPPDGPAPPGWPSYIPWPPARLPELRFRVCEIDAMPQVLIPAGEFLMGSPASEAGRFDDEGPQKRVYLNGYWLDLHAVTNRQYAQFAEATRRTNAEWEQWNHDTYRRHPATYASWEEATAYAAWAGRELPTEAQWERGGRGGTTTAYPWGKRGELGRANGDWDADRVSSHANAVKYCQEVGQHPPNGFGLYDMIGNVWEWCRDCYDAGWYSKMPRAEPQNAANDGSRVYRGGSWGSGPRYLRVAGRFRNSPDFRGSNLGFRCAAPGPPGAPASAPSPVSVAAVLFPKARTAPSSAATPPGPAKAASGPSAAATPQPSPTPARVVAPQPAPSTPPPQPPVALTEGHPDGPAPPGWPSYIPWPPARLPELRFRVCEIDAMPQVRIPAGEFLMGSPESEAGRVSNEGPPQRVHLSAYWLDLHEVTNEQWRRFLTASRRSSMWGRLSALWRTNTQWAQWDQDTGPRHPAVFINWEEARAYALWAGRELPTEAQWEMAARAGTTTTYPWGEQPSCGRANGNWEGDRSYSYQSAVTHCSWVGAYDPNGFGVYDAIGNVWEWCRDSYGDKWSRQLAPADSFIAVPSGERVIRGGSWISSGGHLRVADRLGIAPAGRFGHLGFRCASPAR